MMSDYSRLRVEHRFMGLYVCKGETICIHYCKGHDCTVVDYRSKSAEVHHYPKKIASASFVRIDADLLRFVLPGEKVQSQSSSTKHHV